MAGFLDAPGYSRAQADVRALRIAGNRRRLLRQNATINVMGTSPTFGLGQGNAIGGAISSPVYYPGLTKVAVRGASLGIDTSVTAATTLVTGGPAPVFYKPTNLTAFGDTPSYRVEWFTDATIMEWNYLGTSGPRWRTFVDGVLAQITTVPAGAAGAQPGGVYGAGTPFSPTTSLIWPNIANYYGDGKSHFARLTFASKVLRRITIECGPVTEFGGVIVGKQDTLYPGFPEAYRVMFLGDSYTAGTGADGTMTGWPSILCDLLGWDLWQSGSGGTGYLTANSTNPTSGPKLRDRLATDCYPYTPDAIVIAMGINDASNTAAAIQAEATAVFADIATHLPGTPIYVIGAWQPTSSPGAGLAAANGAIAAAAATAPNVKKFVDPTGWIQGTGNAGTTNATGPADYLISSDGTHPKQLGHEWIGRLLARELASVAY